MINRYLKFLIIFFLIFNFKLNVFAKVQFNFNIKEIEIYEKGKIFKGLKRGTIETNNGIQLIADEFQFNKETNILFANGNVIIKDKINEILVETESVTYLKNNEIIFTNSRSKSTGKNIIIIADSFEFNKKNNVINASGNVISEDLIMIF